MGILNICSFSMAITTGGRCLRRAPSAWCREGATLALTSSDDPVLPSQCARGGKRLGEFARVIEHISRAGRQISVDTSAALNTLKLRDLGQIDGGVHSSATVFSPDAAIEWRPGGLPPYMRGGLEPCRVTACLQDAGGGSLNVPGA